MKIHGPVKQKRKYQYEESHYPREQYVLSGVVAFLRGGEKTDLRLRIRDFGKVRRKIVGAAIFIFSFPIKAVNVKIRMYIFFNLRMYKNIKISVYELLFLRKIIL